MEIKKVSRENELVRAVTYLKHYTIMVGLSLLVVYSGFIFVVAGVAYKEGFFGRVLKPAIEENVNVPLNVLKGITARVDHIDIDIQNKHFHKIEAIREKALAEGVLHTSPEDFVPATIRWNGKSVDGKIRLKGNWIEHWSRDTKWSFLVKTKGKDTIRGMKSFSILHPETRGYLNDWYFLELANFYANCIVLRYDFVDVTLNGKHLGILLMEEHFDDMLIRNNRYVDSVIIKINDRMLRYLDPGVGLTSEHINETYTILPIEAFNTKAVNRNQTYFQYFTKAKNLLELFRRGKLLTHEVFDVDKLARCFAICELMGNQESIAYSNMRFYYNPITSLLEPIIRDNNNIYEATSIVGEGRKLRGISSENEGYSDSGKNIWANTFFKDKIFYKKYIQCLEEISEKAFLDTFFETTEQEFKERLNILYKTFPQYRFKYKSVLYENQKRVRNSIYPIGGIQAYFKKYDEKKGRIVLEVGNTCSLPIEILDVSCNERILKKVNEEVIVQAKAPLEFIDFKAVEFKVQDNVLWTDDSKGRLELTFKVLGTSNIRKVQVYEWSYLDEESLDPEFMREKPNYKEFNFMVVDSKAKELFIKKGVWNISKDMILPEGFTVVCGRGTRINLSNSAKILSHSPIKFIGSDEEPIVITSDDSTGQGIMLLSSGKKSFLENIIFRNLTSPSKGKWKLEGSITFYESPVDIVSCKFVGDRSTSGLNIIRSEFSVRNASFNNSLFNALTILFGKGNISDTLITDCGGDGVNLTGCVVEIETLFCRNISETALSANEIAQISVKEIKIDTTKTGITSSDMSSVIVENADINEAVIGFAVFQKKKAFGPAVVSVKTLKESNITEGHAVEEGSILRIGGKDIMPNKPNVKESLSERIKPLSAVANIKN